VAQIGGVVGPQFFQSKWAHDGYKTSFGICFAFIISAWFANITWYLTRNVDWDVRRIARLRKQAKKEGRVFAGDDVKVFEERQFYTGFWKKPANAV
jgi:MFS transporter, ACS family, DAL5 transporter family protein